MGACFGILSGILSGGLSKQNFKDIPFCYSMPNCQKTRLLIIFKLKPMIVGAMGDQFIIFGLLLFLHKKQR